MTQDEIIEIAKQAGLYVASDEWNWLEAFAKLVAAKAIAELESQERNFCPRCGKRTNDIHTCTPPQRTEQEPVQVSPLEFVEMVMEKEHLIGKPIFWAEWPNQEKNT
jgi:hypothetical protein